MSQMPLIIELKYVFSPGECQCTYTAQFYTDASEFMDPPDTHSETTSIHKYYLPLGMGSKIKQL